MISLTFLVLEFPRVDGRWGAYLAEVAGGAEDVTLPLLGGLPEDGAELPHAPASNAFAGLRRRKPLESAGQKIEQVEVLVVLVTDRGRRVVPQRRPSEVGEASGAKYVCFLRSGGLLEHGAIGPRALTP